MCSGLEKTGECQKTGILEEIREIQIWQSFLVKKKWLLIHRDHEETTVVRSLYLSVSEEVRKEKFVAKY